MKPIKFRAWVYNPWSKEKSLKKVHSIHLWSGRIVVSQGLAEADIPISQCELMQYTGLQDRNGVDIFEGDILHLDYARIEGGRLGTVFAVPGGFGWETFEDEVGQRYLTGYEDMGNKQNAQWLEETAEVIGNIYENPELLEVKK